LHNNPQV